MPQRLNAPQQKWLRYKYLKELISEFDCVWENENDSWGPNPNNPELPNYREFFNIIWDFGPEGIREVDALEITKEFLKKIAEGMESYTNEYDEADMMKTYDQLLRTADYFGFLKLEHATENK
jgi:hypothetical protein